MSGNTLLTRGPRRQSSYISITISLGAGQGAQSSELKVLYYL